MIFLNGCTESNNENNDEGSEDDWRNWPIKSNCIIQVQDVSVENTENYEIFNLEANYVIRVTFILEWRDEPNETGYENQPDSFYLTILTPWEETFDSDTVSNPIGEAGQINITIEIQEEGIANSSANGEWTANIHCVECGDQENESFGHIVMPDNGNEWELTVYYEYHVEE